MVERIQRGRRARRGVTLVEVLIVIAIIALVSSGVALAAFAHVDKTKEKMAKESARTLRAAVKTWWLENDNATCPTVAELVRDRALDRDNSPNDPWGQPWHFECINQDVTITSSGVDRALGTADDIRVPPT